MTQVLLDTHVLVRAMISPEKLPETLRRVIRDPGYQLLFSTASIWEVAIKFSRGREDFTLNPTALRNALLTSGYDELPVTGEHAVAVANLPWVHRDPFDRMLLSQAMVEGVELLTLDKELAQYPGPIRVF